MVQHGEGTVGIQAAMAKLITNPAAALKLLSTRDTHIAGLKLSPSDDEQLLRFLDEHGSNFKISVLLLKKRRFDGIIASYGIIPKLYSEYELACFWDDYLTLIQIDDVIEKNPINESIRFGEYLMKQLAVTDAHRDLVAYDVLRNQVVVDAGQDETDYASKKLSQHKALNPNSSAPFVHPSLKVGRFAINVSVLVKLFNEGVERSKVLSACDPSDETILFYKNWRLGGVGTLKATSFIAALAPRMNGNNSIAELYSSFGSIDETNDKRMHNLLGLLYKTGMILYVSVPLLSEQGY